VNDPRIFYKKQDPSSGNYTIISMDIIIEI